MHRAARQFRFRVGRLTTVVIVGVVALVLGLVGAVTASAGTSSGPQADGVIAAVVQHRDQSVSVSGFAWATADHNKQAYVCVGVGDRCLRIVKGKSPSPRFDREHHLSGQHAFHAHIPAVKVGAVITLRTVRQGHVLLDRMKAATAGQRVLRVAKRFVGRVPYVYGGSSPRTGFDCSGYAMYSYRTAGVADLPHNSQQQRFSRHMHRISRAHALPGDLVFYMSGSYSYHTAIYAGHGMQVSAADPREGIRYQRIWDRNVIFGTDWH